MDKGTKRMLATLKAKHPELFDSQGKLDRDKVTEAIKLRTGGKTLLTKEDVLTLSATPRSE